MANETVGELVWASRDKWRTKAKYHEARATEVERQRDALLKIVRFYADEGNYGHEGAIWYDLDEEPTSRPDGGAIARAALGALECARDAEVEGESDG